MKVEIKKIAVFNSKTESVCQTDYGNVSLHFKEMYPNIDIEVIYNIKK